MDLKQTYAVGVGGTYWFQCESRASAGQILVCMISLESMDGMSPNLHGYIIGTSLRVDTILVTLTVFSKS